MELAFSPFGNQFDSLTIQGNFSAGGNLMLSILAGTPDGLPITLVTADHLIGTFSNAPDGTRLLDATGTGSYVVNYSPTSLFLTDFQPIPEPLSAALLAPAALLLLKRHHRARSVSEAKRRITPTLRLPRRR